MGEGDVAREERRGVVEGAQEQQPGGPGGEGGGDALGDEAVAEFEDGAGAGGAARVGAVSGEGGLGQFVLADEQFGVLGAHEHGAALFEAGEDLVVAAALGGEVGDEAGFADAGGVADGQAVLVDAEWLAGVLDGEGVGPGGDGVPEGLEGGAFGVGFGVGEGGAAAEGASEGAHVGFVVDDGDEMEEALGDHP